MTSNQNSSTTATDSNQADTNKNTQNSHQPRSPKPAAPKGSRLGALAIIISLVVGGSLGAYSYHKNQQYQRQINQLQKSLQSNQQATNSALENAQQHFDQQAKHLQDNLDTALKQQSESLDSLQMAIAKLKGRRTNDWLLAEADYFVKLAGRKLYLEHDPSTAVALVESADERIAALNDPSLTSLRQAMANDITALKAIPHIDQDGLVLRLSSLEHKVDSLPLANAIIPKAQATQTETVSTDINDWQTNLWTSLKDFAGHFITFRTRDGNVVPLLSPKQDFYLRENMKAKIETAIRAVYNHQPTIYADTLNTASDWAGRFFSDSDNTVQSFRSTLTNLAGKKVKVDYPVKLESQEKLSALIHERLRRQVSSLTVEDK
ncbi:MAG: uroporphyrinogen-III C-methyltransferase [Vibrio sp.]